MAGQELETSEKTAIKNFMEVWRTDSAAGENAYKHGGSPGKAATKFLNWTSISFETLRKKIPQYHAHPEKAANDPEFMKLLPHFEAIEAIGNRKKEEAIKQFLVETTKEWSTAPSQSSSPSQQNLPQFPPDPLASPATPSPFTPAREAALMHQLTPEGRNNYKYLKDMAKQATAGEDATAVNEVLEAYLELNAANQKALKAAYTPIFTHARYAHEQAAVAGARGNGRLAQQLSRQANALGQQAGQVALRFEANGAAQLQSLIAQSEHHHHGDPGWELFKPHMQALHASQTQRLEHAKSSMKSGGFLSRSGMSISGWIGIILGGILGFKLTGGFGGNLVTSLIGGAIMAVFAGWSGNRLQQWAGNLMNAPSPSPRGNGIMVMSPSQQQQPVVATAKLPDGVTEVSRADPLSPPAGLPAAQVKNNLNAGQQSTRAT